MCHEKWNMRGSPIPYGLSRRAFQKNWCLNLELKGEQKIARWYETGWQNNMWKGQLNVAEGGNSSYPAWQNQWKRTKRKWWGYFQSHRVGWDRDLEATGLEGPWGKKPKSVWLGTTLPGVFERHAQNRCSKTFWVNQRVNGVMVYARRKLVKGRKRKKKRKGSDHLNYTLWHYIFPWSNPNAWNRRNKQMS